MPAVEHRLLSSMLAAPHFRNGAEVTLVVYTVPEQSGWQASEPITLLMSMWFRFARNLAQCCQIARI